MAADIASPYLMDEPPTSSGKALLSRAFEHWCAIHHGHRPEDIVAALGPDDPARPADRRQLRFAARLLGELMAAKEMRSFARPFGAGSPMPLPAAVWERDDFAP